MSSATADKYFLSLKVAVGRAAQTQGIAAVARRFDVPVDFVRYHEQKYSDPSFHSGTWGGARHVVFSDLDQQYVEVGQTPQE